MTLRLNGATSGFTEIDAPAVAGSNTLVLPTGNGTADQALVTNGSGTLSFADRGRMVLATAQNTTSGTSIDFTGIPSWVKRVTVMFNGVSTSGTSLMLLRIGSSGGIEATGYSAGSAAGTSTGQYVGSLTDFPLNTPNAAVATDLLSGAVVLTNVNSNTWVLHGSTYRGPTYGVGAFCGGSKTLSGTLDRLRLTTVNGTDTFDAGSINILYEG